MRTSTGREPARFYTTVLVAHRNSVPSLTGRRPRLGLRWASIATSIGTFSIYQSLCDFRFTIIASTLLLIPLPTFDMSLPFPLPAYSTKYEVMLIRFAEATTAMISQETLTVNLRSDILGRLFLPVLVGTMRRGAISASRIERGKNTLRYE
jgi:hypothetical protein